MITRSNIALLVLLLAGCGSAGNTAGSGAHNPDLITREQITAGKFRNAYDVVEAIHSNWLISRPTLLTEKRSMSGRAATDSTAGAARPMVPEDDRSGLGEGGGVQVYLDAVRMGGISQLKLIPATSIVSIRHYKSTDAQTRFGIGHAAGVIYVSTHDENGQ